MPPKYRKKTYRKKTYTRKPKPALTMMGKLSRGVRTVRQIAGAVNQMRSMINCEKKFHDVSYGLAVNNSANTYAQLLNGISEGDDYLNRNGRSILNSSININYTAKVNSSATNTLLRLVLICDKKPDNTSAATYLQIYGTALVNGHINKASEGDRFVIMAKRTIKLNPLSGQSATGSLFYTLTGTHTKYDGTGGTANDVEKNAYYVVAVSDEATNTPTLEIYSRFSFFDN